MAREHTKGQAFRSVGDGEEEPGSERVFEEETLEPLEPLEPEEEEELGDFRFEE